jgi:hypothetical protein
MQWLNGFMVKGKENMVCKISNPYMVWNNLFIHGNKRLMHDYCLIFLKEVLLITKCISKELRENTLWS